MASVSRPRTQAEIKLLDQLYERIESTRDRLIFIRHTPSGASAASWALVQVDLDCSSRAAARRRGQYNVRWFGAHPDDKRYCSLRQSRFWPMLHRVDGDGCLKEQVIVSPDDVHSLLDKDMKWYQMGVNLADSRLSEPFDFATLRSSRNSRMDKNRIKNTHWAEMMQSASVYGIDTSDVDIVPDKPSHEEEREEEQSNDRNKCENCDNCTKKQKNNYGNDLTDNLSFLRDIERQVLTLAKTVRDYIDKAEKKEEIDTSPDEGDVSVSPLKTPKRSSSDQEEEHITEIRDDETKSNAPMSDSDRDKSSPEKDDTAGGGLSDGTICNLTKMCEMIMKYREADTERLVSELFLEKPCKKTYPSYYKLIKSPIAINDILQKCKKKLYSTISEFTDDWKLLYSNARTYNEDGSRILDDAGTLEHELDRLMKKYGLAGTPEPRLMKPQRFTIMSKKMKNVVRNVPIECSNSRERKNDKRPTNSAHRVSLTESEEAEGKAENMSDTARVPDELKTTDDLGASAAKKETIVNKRRKVGGGRSSQSEGRKVDDPGGNCGLNDVNSTSASNDVVAVPASVARRSFRLQQQNHQKDSHEESSPLDQFYERIENTRDRLLFIRYTPPGASAATWALVQVDLDYTNERAARRQGRYHVRWFAAHPDDKKCCSIRLSRFWPVIHRIDKKGYFRKQIIVSPDDVHSLLDRRKDLGWYQMGVNLAASRLSEPFDFATLRSANSSCMVRYRVKNISWIEMMQNASVYGIGTSDVDNDPTIQRPGRKRRRG